MIIKEIAEKLNNIHLQNISLEDFDKQIQAIKFDFVKKCNHEKAKLLWVYQTIIEIHKLYVNAFNFIKMKSYYQAWCKLETIEITLHILKKHFTYDKKQYFLWHIEKSIKNLQVLYPYKLFASSEILTKKKKCSICNKEISIRNSCGHIVGEIYMGELCHCIVTESELLGISIVDNPENKYSVLFLIDKETGEQIDQYNYDAIDFLFEQIANPYDLWDLEVSIRELNDEEYKLLENTVPNPYNSNKIFKNCFLSNKYKYYLHFEIVLLNMI